MDDCKPGSLLLTYPLGSWRLTEKIYNDDFAGNFFDNYIDKITLLHIIFDFSPLRLTEWERANLEEG